MRIGKLAVALGLVTVAGCQVPSTLTPAEQNVQRQIIEDMIDTWSQALNNRDQDAALAAYATGAGVSWAWHDGSRGMGMEEIRGAVEAFYDTIQYMNFVPQNPRVEVLATNTATVSFRYSMDLRFNDTRRDVSSGNGLLVLTRPDEETDWKIYKQLIARRP